MKRLLMMSMFCAVAGGAMADYSVLVSYEGGAIVRYTVSSDGLTWTNAGNFLDTGSGDTYAVPGDGWVYVGTSGKKIVRYRAGDPSVCEDWLTGLPFAFTRLAVSPDRTWIYAMPTWASATYDTLYRYRLSDKSGGKYALTGTATRVRGLVIGPDGTLYLGARGNNTTDTDPSSAGVHAYDVQSYSEPSASRYLGQYEHAMTTAGTGVILNGSGSKLYSTVNSTLRCYDVGTFGAPVTTQTFPNNGNYLATVRLGDNLFFGDYANGYVCRLTPEGQLSRVATLGTKLCGFTDMTDAAATDSNLDSLTHYYPMNEPDVSDRFNNAVNSAKFNVYKGSSVSGSTTGASGRGIKVLGGTCNCVSSDGNPIVPETGDFTFAIWAYVGNRQRGTAATVFSTGRTHFGVDAGGCLTLTGDSGVDVSGTRSVLGDWHWLVYMREGGKVKLFVDDALDVAADVPADTPFETDPDCLANVKYQKLSGRVDGTGTLRAAYLDELRVYAAALTDSDRAFLYALVKDQSRSGADERKAAALGKVVLSRADVDAGVAPAVAKTGDRLFVASDATIVRSSDGFATKTECTGTGLHAQSLFACGSSICAVGADKDERLSVATSADNGTTWTVRKLGNDIGVPLGASLNALLRDGTLAVAMPSSNQTGIVVVKAPFQGGEPGTAVLTDVSIPTNTPSNSFKSPHRRFSAVTLAEDSDGGLIAVGSSERTAPKYAEALVFAKIDGSGSGAYDLTLSFPGGSKPLAILKDASGGRYWAVASAHHYKDRSSSVSPVSRATSLALYSSDDLFDWYYHGDVVTPETSAYLAAPSLVADGDDLLIVYGAGFAESGVASDTTGRPFVVMSRVTGFRGMRPVGKKWRHRQRLLVCADYEDAVLSYEEDPGTGDWIPAGVFARGTYGGKRLGCPTNARTRGQSVFIIGITGGASKTGTGVNGIFEFTCDGDFVRFYATPQPTDGLDVSPDGRTIYATRWFSTSFYIIDRSTGTATEANLSGHVQTPRGIVALSNGDVAVGSRNKGTVVIANGTTGAYVATIPSTVVCGKETPGTTDGPWSLNYDGKTGTLLAVTGGKGIRRISLDEGNAYANPSGTLLYSHGGGDNVIDAIPADDGSLFLTGFNLGCVCRLREDGGSWTNADVDPIAGSYDVFRGCFVNASKPGMSLILR